MLANSHNAHTLCCDPPAAGGANHMGQRILCTCPFALLLLLPPTRTHTRACSRPPSLFYYLVAAVSVLLPASAHLHNSNMAFLSSLSSLARAAAAAAPVGGGHIKAFTWQHIQLHAICINCLSLPPTHCLSLSFAAACQPKLLPFDFGNYNAFLCNNLSFVLSFSLSLCLSQLA